MSAATQYIYVLKCPDTGAVRYVGKCLNLKARLRQHLSEARIGGGNSHKLAWIRSLLRRGAKPIMEVDAVVEAGKCWKRLEIERIAYHRAQGERLTNGTTGGDGAGPLTAAGRRALSRRAIEQFSSPEARQRQSELMTRLCADEEFRRTRDAAAKATRATPEYKAAASARSKALWADPAYREKYLKSRAVLYANPEYRAKISKANRAAKGSAEARERAAELARAAWADPAIRERQTLAIRRACASTSGKDAKP